MQVVGVAYFLGCEIWAGWEGCLTEGITVRKSRHSGSTGTVNLRAGLYAAGVVKDVLDGLFAQKAVSCSCGLLIDLHYRR